jgi:hypothetical protein
MEFRTLRMHLKPLKSQIFLNRSFIYYKSTLAAESLQVSTSTASKKTIVATVNSCVMYENCSK